MDTRWLAWMHLLESRLLCKAKTETLIEANRDCDLLVRVFLWVVAYSEYNWFKNANPDKRALCK